MTNANFDSEYKKLNLLQKRAVDTIEGPVMVVAGPGTGKTQVLALRIGNILQKTDVKSDGILCLTFTNAAVKAMRERLRRYLGAEGGRVKVATFHSFGMEMLEKYYGALGLDSAPKIMGEDEAVTLADRILHAHPWEHIRPRSDSARYFRDLKSLITLLKRERLGAEDFRREVEQEIENIKKDPENISSRGESKGGLKQDAERKIAALGRTLEAVRFYALYEEAKREANLYDYDDILESLNQVVERSEEAKNFMLENYLYVLIDEHQDSSGVQNEFLRRVWGQVERPNIFVVGDDRQLIYGFGGASLEYFENFRHTFGRAELVTLTENYRSTQKILDSAHELLQSALSREKLKSNSKESHDLRLVEAYYPRDEIIAAGLEIRARIAAGEDPDGMAILSPKNRQVRSAVKILADLGVPVAGGEAVNFFETLEARSLLRVLRIIANPGDGVALGETLFDKLSQIPPVRAHEFIKSVNMREFSLLSIKAEKNNLFQEGSEVNAWIAKLKAWLDISTEEVYTLVQRVGTEFLLDTAKTHEELLVRIEVVRTVLHLVLASSEKTQGLQLPEFLEFLARVEKYGEHIPLAVFAPEVGVRVLTLHGSKGLEFDYVWIAHMDERSFGGRAAGGFALPLSVEEKVEKRSAEVEKRELYVAITRAKRFCTVSYARNSHTGGDQELAHIVADIAENFEKQSAKETEEFILKNDQRAYVEKNEKSESRTIREELVKLVARDYEDRKVSVSLLNNFFECPWKWYFRNLLQLPEPRSASLEFGSKIHAAVDRILRLRKVPSREEILKASGGDREVEKVVAAWAVRRLGDISERRENEESVSVSDPKFPQLTIYGKIDLLEQMSDGSMRVTDFKTGSVRKKSEIEKLDDSGRMSNYLRQLAMYSYLIGQNPKWKARVGASRLEFLEAKSEKESIYDHAVTADEIGLLVKDIEDYSELVKKGEWIHQPCNYNSYGSKNTECEYCKMGEIYT